MTLKIVVERGEDGYFVAHCPSLKSCWSQGKTWDEALANIREAIDLYLEPSPKRILKDTLEAARKLRKQFKRVVAMRDILRATE